MNTRRFIAAMSFGLAAAFLTTAPASAQIDGADASTTNSQQSAYVGTSSAMPCRPQGGVSEPLSSPHPTGVSTMVSPPEYKPLCAGGGIFMAGNRLRISAFSIPKGPKKYAPGMRYSIERDHAGHGGGYWKLFDGKTRIGTYKKDGWPRNAQP